MNKTELVARIAAANGIGDGQAREMVTAVFDGLIATLLESERVSIRGFGAFEIREHKEKSGRNPQTGERITLPARHAIVYTASRTLRKALDDLP